MIKNNCYKIGKSAENRFAYLLGQRGWDIQLATEDQDILEHWDIMASKGNEFRKIDVKARKRINRYDAQSQDNKIWVEITNVHGNIGWLFGEAQYIAFETLDGFILIEVCKLIYISMLTIISGIQIKTRNGRSDRIMLIDSKVILENGWLLEDKMEDRLYDF